MTTIPDTPPAAADDARVIALIGFARTEMSDDAYRTECREALTKFIRSKPFNPEVWARVEKATYYVAGADYGDADAHARLADKLSKTIKG